MFVAYSVRADYASWICRKHFCEKICKEISEKIRKTFRENKSDKHFGKKISRGNFPKKKCTKHLGKKFQITKLRNKKKSGMSAKIFEKKFVKTSWSREQKGCLVIFYWTYKENIQNDVICYSQSFNNLIDLNITLFSELFRPSPIQNAWPALIMCICLGFRLIFNALPNCFVLGKRKR